ncbi:hypothetical protein PLESTB_000648300 [Pleodorina starrii]|uniref:ABC transporter domain-containing protein n=1 Tax=Pleodorina starrii TaxID=330485 RepID=A0A9W6F1R8_9CHLO|nr:hypothetical protein PLESTB_000648300 [Pleodorina starrii]GLC71610.1 hypothetical protein PLESTF_001140900 [Pleodorina starrii]
MHGAGGPRQSPAAATAAALRRQQRPHLTGLRLCGGFGATLLVALLAVSAGVASSMRRLTASPGGLGGVLAPGAAPAPPAQQPHGGGGGATAGSLAAELGNSPSRAVAQCPVSSITDGAATAAAVAGNGTVTNSGLCQCSPGWGGAACSRCQAGWPLACASLLPSDPKSTCETTLAYTNHTLYKVQSCMVDESLSQFLASLEAYCSTVPVSPLFPAYDALRRQLNITGFNMSRYENITGGAAATGGAQNSTVAAGGAGAGGDGSPAATNATAAVRVGGSTEPLEVYSPYCLVDIRAGTFFKSGSSLQCIGLGCEFVEGSQSYMCSGGMRCGCPPKDPALLAAGAPVSMAYCSDRTRSFAAGMGTSFGLSCNGPDVGAGGGKCKLSVEGVGFDVPLTCSPNECRTVAAASVVASALSSGGPPPPPPVQDWVPLVAALPMAVVALLAAAMAAGLLAHRRHFAAVWGRYGGDSRSGKDGGALGGDGPPAEPDDCDVVDGEDTYAAAAAAVLATLPYSGGGGVSKLLGPSSDGVSGGAGGKRTALVFDDVTVEVPYSRLFFRTREYENHHHHHHPHDELPIRRGNTTCTEDSTRGQTAGGGAGGVSGGGNNRGWAGRGRDNDSERSDAASGLCWGRKWAWARSGSVYRNLPPRGVGGGIGGGGGGVDPPLFDALPPSSSAAAPAAAEVLRRRRWRSILAGVSGFALEGEMLGLVGPSGCGKSTLLSVLSSSFAELPPTSRVGGAVSLGGERRSATLRRLTGLVAQSDVLPPSLTVSECIGYSAALRLAAGTPPEEVKARVAAVVSELGLERVASSLVGVGSGAAGGGAAGTGAAARGISGGERRRVTIGMELVISPRLLVLDEPTSGLDSWAASNLMQTCHAVASHGRVVVMSLHQPSPDMVARLDRLLVLAPGGRQAFFGTPQAAPGHCAAAGWPCPPGRAICEHLLRLANRQTAAKDLVAVAEKERSAAAAVAAAAAAAASAGAVIVPETTSEDDAKAGAAGGGGSGGAAAATEPSPAALHGSTPPPPPPSPSTPPQQAVISHDSCMSVPEPSPYTVTSGRRTETPAPWGAGEDSPAAAAAAGGGGSRHRLGPMERLGRRGPALPVAAPTHGSVDGRDDAATVTTRPSSPSSTTVNTNSPRGWTFGADCLCSGGGGGAAAAGATPAAPGGGAAGGPPGFEASAKDAVGLMQEVKVNGRSGGGAALAAPPPEAAAAAAAAGGVGGCGGGSLVRWWRSCCLLFWRSGVDMARTPGLLLLHCGLAVAAGVVVGLIFLRQKADLTGMQNASGAIFFSLCLFGFTSLTSVDGLVRERALVAREVAGHYYSPAAYLLPRLVLDALLLRALPAALYTAALYPLVALTPGAGRVASFALVLAAFAASVGALALCVAAVARSAATLTLVMNLLLLLWVMVGGYLVNPTSMPAALAWLRYASPLSYAFEALLANQVKGTYFIFDVAGYARVDDVSSELFMTALGLSPSHALRDVAVLAGFYGGFALGALALTWLGSARRGEPTRGSSSSAAAGAGAGAAGRATGAAGR